MQGAAENCKTPAQDHCGHPLRSLSRHHVRPASKCFSRRRASAENANARLVRCGRDYKKILQAFSKHVLFVFRTAEREAVERGGEMRTNRPHTCGDGR